MFHVGACRRPFAPLAPTPLCRRFRCAFLSFSSLFVSRLFLRSSIAHRIKRIAVPVTHDILLSRVLAAEKRVWTTLVLLDKDNARREKGEGKGAPDILSHHSVPPIYAQFGYAPPPRSLFFATLAARSWPKRSSALRVWNNPFVTTLRRRLRWPTPPENV